MGCAMICGLPLELRLLFVSFSETDDADPVWLRDVAEKVQSPIQIAHRNAPCLTLANLGEKCRL
jgi:hypothetical protein